MIPHDTIKYFGDKAQLAYIRARYNELLNRKDAIETAIRGAHYTATEIQLLTQTRQEMLRLDDLRTALVNPNHHQPIVTNIKPVSLRQGLKSIFVMQLPKYVSPMAGKARKRAQNSI